MRVVTSVSAAALGAVLTLTACSREGLAPVGPEGQFSHSASENTGAFDWFFGSDFPFFDPGPSVSHAKDGSRIEISGMGSFSVGEGKKSVSGGGTFEIFDSSNTMVASGNWTAERLRGYVDYGGAAANPDLRGGTMEAEIHLDGLGKGSIWIFCLISTPPPPSKEEGVHVKVGRWHFDDIGAFDPNIFIRT